MVGKVCQIARFPVGVVRRCWWVFCFSHEAGHAASREEAVGHLYKGNVQTGEGSVFSGGRRRGCTHGCAGSVARQMAAA